jgi:hypothetical protein
MIRRLAIAIFLVALPARADSAAETERAEQLFREASSLVEKGDYAAACPKLAESQRLDPALGTQYNLALCYEKVGRLGSAWRNLRSVARLARASGKKGREEVAQKMMNEMRSRVPHVVVVTHEPVTITVDGERIEPDDQSFVAVDAGEHLVEATAPARVPWNERMKVTAETRIDIPPLRKVEGTRVITVESGSGRRTLGFALGAAGLVGVGTAAVTGILILRDKSVADEKCTPGCVDEEGRDAVSRGETLVPINYVAWGVALAGLGAGAYFLVTAKKQTQVSVTSNGASLRVVGTF